VVGCHDIVLDGRREVVGGYIGDQLEVLGGCLGWVDWRCSWSSGCEAAEYGGGANEIDG